MEEVPLEDHLKLALVVDARRIPVKELQQGRLRLLSLRISTAADHGNILRGDLQPPGRSAKNISVTAAFCLRAIPSESSSGQGPKTQGTEVPKNRQGEACGVTVRSARIVPHGPASVCNSHLPEQEKSPDFWGFYKSHVVRESLIGGKV